MLTEGADFTNSHYRHYPTVTAVGHSTFLSGATPSVSGIIGNEWWDRTTGAVVTSVSDPQSKLVGGSGTGSSPWRLLQSTVGDELKASGKGGKVIGISIKDRSAILPSRHSADAAYWFDVGSGNFVNSTYYFAKLPPWVAETNQHRPADKYAGREWMAHKMPAVSPALYPQWKRPYGNELIQQFALRAWPSKIGHHHREDRSAHRELLRQRLRWHRYGPTPRKSTTWRCAWISWWVSCSRLPKRRPARNVLAVLTADHGVARFGKS
jgi:hypothetical protein